MAIQTRSGRKTVRSLENVIPLLYLFSPTHSQLLLPLVEFINRGAAETDIEWGIQGFENEFHKLCGGKLVFMRETGKGRKSVPQNIRHCQKPG
jgi:hypothetical protein